MDWYEPPLHTYTHIPMHTYIYMRTRTAHSPKIPGERAFVQYWCSCRHRVGPNSTPHRSRSTVAATWFHAAHTQHCTMPCSAAAWLDLSMADKGALRGYTSGAVGVSAKALLLATPHTIIKTNVWLIGAFRWKPCGGFLSGTYFTRRSKGVWG